MVECDTHHEIFRTFLPSPDESRGRIRNAPGVVGIPGNVGADHSLAIGPAIAGIGLPPPPATVPMLSLVMGRPLAPAVDTKSTVLPLLSLFAAAIVLGNVHITMLPGGIHRAMSAAYPLLRFVP